MPSESQTIPSMFKELPEFALPLPQDELRLLASLPIYGASEAVAEVDQADEAACQRLKRRGLVKVHRWKDDPIQVRPTMYAGKISST